MKMTFRWYGEGDSIPLSYIRQIPGMTGVVTAVYDVPVGEAWHTDRIASLKALCDREQLEMEVIESVPVHEDIKLGRPTRDRLIENYAQTVRNLGKFGVKCVCYNVMPVFDWLRTILHTPAPDGSNSLSYRHAELTALDPHDLHLPGWDESYTPAELRGLLDAYSAWQSIRTIRRGICSGFRASSQGGRATCACLKPCRSGRTASPSARVLSARGGRTICRRWLGSLPTVSASHTCGRSASRGNATSANADTGPMRAVWICSPL